jgi:hypothetical protein
MDLARMITGATSGVLTTVRRERNESGLSVASLLADTLRIRTQQAAQLWPISIRLRRASGAMVRLRSQEAEEGY